MEILFYLSLGIFRRTSYRPGAVAEQIFKEGIISSRMIVDGVLLVMLSYVLLVVFVPMMVAYFSHGSKNLIIKAREIGILFKESIRWAKWTVLIIIFLYIVNYFLATSLLYGGIGFLWPV